MRLTTPAKRLGAILTAAGLVCVCIGATTIRSPKVEIVSTHFPLPEEIDACVEARKKSFYADPVVDLRQAQEEALHAAVNEWHFKETCTVQLEAREPRAVPFGKRVLRFADKLERRIRYDWSNATEGFVYWGARIFAAGLLLLIAFDFVWSLALRGISWIRHGNPQRDP